MPGYATSSFEAIVPPAVRSGLLYATCSFRYVRNALSVGVLCVFVPSLGVVLTSAHTLLGIWVAKAGLNAWRCATAIVRIHCQLWPRWRAATDDAALAEGDARCESDRIVACDAVSASEACGSLNTSHPSSDAFAHVSE